MSESVSCPDCKYYIGESINIEGVDLLQVGGMLMWEMRGACPGCKRIMYWSVRDKVIERAIKQSTQQPKTPT